MGFAFLLATDYWLLATFSSPIIIELNRYLRRMRPQISNHRLQLILLGTAHPQRFPLDAGVDLQLQVLDPLLNGLGGLLVDSVLELDLLAEGLVRGLF